MGSDMMQRTNPSVVVSEVFNLKPTRTVVSKDDYFFIFGMQHTETYVQFYDPSLYNASLYWDVTDNINPNNSGRFPIPIERCTEAHIPPNLLEYFQKVVYGDLSQLVCMKKDHDGKYDLEGTWDGDVNKRIQIYIRTCVNSTESSQICKSQEEIDKVMKSGYFTLYATDNIVDLRNFESPGQKKGRDYFIQTSYGLTKQIVRWLSTSHINSDEGWITNDVKNMGFTVFYTDKESFEMYDANKNGTKTLIDFVIRKQNVEKVFERKYKKIQNVFAEMGGFMNLSFLVFYVLIMPYVTSSFFNSMTSKLYNFQNDVNSTSTKDSVKDTKRLQSMNSIFNKDKNNNQIEDSVKNTPKKNAIDTVFMLKETPLNLTFWEQLKQIFSRKENIQEKISQKKVGVNAFLEKLDLSFILNKFLEIEKLKVLLLNEDQYHLFGFFPKPFITKTGKILLNCANPVAKVPTSPKRKSEIVANMDSTNKAKLVKQAYFKITQKTNPDHIDEKLIELIDEEVKQLLDANEAATAFTFKVVKEVEIPELKSNFSEGPMKMSERIKKYTETENNN